MNILCTGPGPHDPVDGILGETDDEVAPTGYLCQSPACQAPVLARASSQAANRALSATAMATVQATIAANTAFMAIVSPTTDDLIAQVRTLTASQTSLIFLLLQRLG